MSWIEERKGRACWVACWKVDGKKCAKSTGIPLKQAGKTAKQLRKAAEEVAQSMEDAAKNTLPMHKLLDKVRDTAERAGMGGKMPTVREYLREFQGQAGPKTEKNRRRAFNVFLDFLGDKADMRLDTLTKDILRDFFRHELEEVSRGTVGLYRSYLAAAFNRALDDDLIARSPMPRVDLAREAAAVNPELGRDKVERLPFTTAELRIIFERFPAPWCHLAQVAIYGGGQRLGDVCCLRWDSVDFKRGAISFTTQKTGHKIDNPLLPRLRELLEGLWKMRAPQDEYVFPEMARRYKYSNSTVSTEFTGLLRAWGIVKPKAAHPSPKGRRRSVSEKSFHSFRHSFTSLARSNPALTHDMVRSVVGHDSEEVERAYYTASTEQKMQVLQGVDAALHAGAPALPPYPATA